MNSRDQAPARLNGSKADRQQWDYDGMPAEDRLGADLTGGLVNLGFFSGTLRRRAWIWCLTAVLGLLLGSALYVKFPPAYHATTTVVLTDSSSVNPEVQVLVDQSLAQSQAVAGRVVRALNLPETVSAFQTKYTVTIVTDTVLTMEVGAKSSTDAVRQASALATAFLGYRAQYEQAQEQQLFAELDQQYSAAQKRLRVLQGQISQLPTPLGSPARKAQYADLQTQAGQQQQILQYVTSTRAAAKTNTTAMLTGSFVIDPATAIPRSKVREPMLYVGGGFFIGLVAGMAIVIFVALMSRRLRRRDDVALALDAPVLLSVGPLRSRRFPPALPRTTARRQLAFKRVVAHLQGAVPGSSRGPASLAVVAVDAPDVVAEIVLALATSCAADGKRVIVADLSATTVLGNLLGFGEAGIHKVSHEHANLLLAIPDPDEVAPVGPVPSGASPAVRARAAAALVSACSSANVLLTFAVLNPAFGGDHLGTWATNAVAVVTAGESSPEKIHAVGEMIRLSGARLDSAVLIGTDKRDESLGIIEQPLQSAVMTRPTDKGRRRRGAAARPEPVEPV